MKAFDIGELVFLAALWGASFLFMRLGAHEFGPIALAAVRVGLASAMLIPLLASRGQLAELRTHWKGLLLVGALNSAIPFALFSFAALSITAGLSSIVNATTPLWTAVVAFLWLRPGMDGIGKIAVDRRKLIAIWSRDLIDWLRLKVWRWWP